MRQESGSYLEDVQADRAGVDIHVGVEAWSLEFDRGRNVGVVGGEDDAHSERELMIDLTSKVKKESAQRRVQHTVSEGPSIVPTQSKRFPSFLGNADCTGC